MAALDLQIEKGQIEEIKTYKVTAKLTFTQADLDDTRPIQLTKKELFELLAVKEEQASGVVSYDN
jgi:hypothetical protein